MQRDSDEHRALANQARGGTEPTQLWGCPVYDYAALTREYGSPLFVFLPELLARNIDILRDALIEQYPPCRIAYSVKTNYLPHVLHRVAASGVALELVSGFELDLADRFGYVDSQTVINGPLKTANELRRIVERRCTINVDNLTELEILESVAADQGRTVEIGLRVASEFGAQPWHRFGFDAANIVAVATRLPRDFPHLKLAGLHIHGGTNIIDLRYFRAAAELLCGIAKDLRAMHLTEVAYLDLGGGFATACAFRDHAQWQVPSAAEYAEALAGAIKASFGTDGPQLIVEPGRYLVDDSFILLTTVERFRNTGGTEAIIDAGINIFPSARFRRHRVACVSKNSSSRRQAYALYGPMCMRSDCLADAIELPPLERGDVLAFDYAGAYNMSQAWTFIQAQPAVVAIEKGKAKLVRRRQTIEDILARDLL